MPYPTVLLEAATIQEAVKGRSLARFGDGELKLCLGRHAKSQRHDAGLVKFLRRALLDPSGPCLPCIPGGPSSGTPKAEFWRDYWAPRYERLFVAGGVYGSSWVTRPDSAPWIATPAYWALVRSLWEGKDCVLVGSSGKALQAGELVGAASVEHIQAPVRDAWADEARLWDRLKHERRTVILCLGATATALAFRLAERGVHALDLGHIALFMRRAEGGLDPTTLSHEEKSAE